MLIIYPWAVSSGDCTITILRPASDLFEEFRLDWPLKVIMKSAPAAKSNQDIVFPVISAPSVGQNVTLSATGGSSGNAVTFSSKTPAVCTVEGTVLSALTEGECIVTADQAGNDKFNAAPQKTQTVTIVAAALAKTPQTITLGTAPEPISVGANVTLSATGGDSGNALTFASQTPEICTVEGSVLTAKAVGSCVVEVNQKGNDQYGDAPAQLLTVTIKEAVAAVAAKTEQTITFAPLSPVAVGSTATLAAIGGDSGNPLRFSALTPDTCTVNGTTLTAVAEGKCSVAADQDGNDTFSPATQKTLDVSIVKEITTFSVTVNVLGELTAQTIIAKINPASSEAGKNGSEFLAAQLGDMTFLYGAGGWVQYSGADSVVALSSGALASHELTLLDNVDMTPLLGAQIFVGYGLGDSLAEAYSEMQKASRMMSVYKVE
ncbi:MAG: hypothetical protein KGZ83_12655 [Sulfuricella sp.]|nr:hypothetical protein [Sulfuricella sp.]